MEHAFYFCEGCRHKYQTSGLQKEELCDSQSSDEYLHGTNEELSKGNVCYCKVYIKQT